MPLGIAHAGGALLAPGVLVGGLAILSSTAPYSLEMLALRRLPSHVFRLVVSASPAVASLIGFVMLWAVISCIVCVSAGSALGKAGGVEKA